MPPCFYPLLVRSRGSPRKFATEQELYAVAVRALMRRAHSIHEMKKYLEQRAEDANQVKPVLARLRELKYLDDARYAHDFARTHAKLRRQGRFRITRELRARGVADQHIEAALDKVFEETDEASLVRTRLQRRLAHIRGPLDQRKIASLYGSLLRAGFSSDIIRAELRIAVKTSEEEIPEVDGAEIPEAASEDS